MTILSRIIIAFGTLGLFCGLAALMYYDWGLTFGKYSNFPWHILITTIVAGIFFSITSILVLSG